MGDGRERFGAAFLADSGSSCGEIQGNSKVSVVLVLDWASFGVAR